MVDELSESHHLAGTKWRGTWRAIHIDLYAPYQSRLGANLQLRVEALAPYAEAVEGRRLLSVPAHIATKVAALLDRPDSLPGRKDRQELLNLLALPGSAGARGDQSRLGPHPRRSRGPYTAGLCVPFWSAGPGAPRPRRLRQLAQHWRLAAAPGPPSDAAPRPLG